MILSIVEKTNEPKNPGVNTTSLRNVSILYDLIRNRSRGSSSDWFLTFRLHNVSYLYVTITAGSIGNLNSLANVNIFFFRIRGVDCRKSLISSSQKTWNLQSQILRSEVYRFETKRFVFNFKLEKTLKTKIVALQWRYHE